MTLLLLEFDVSCLPPAGLNILQTASEGLLFSLFDKSLRVKSMGSGKE